MPDDKEDFNPNIIFEKRKFVRIGGTFVVSYIDITTAEAKTDITQTRNISVGGLLLTTDKQFSPGTMLRIKLRLPASLDYINVKAQVMDSKPQEKTLLYETRVKFVGISAEDKETIRKIVEHNLSNQ